MKQIVAVLLFCITVQAKAQKKPMGNAWVQQYIPGKVQCEFYNKGGEGVAYHDADTINNGSGKLNPPNGNYYNEFRMFEGVDISYTKPKKIDDNSFNRTKPLLNQLYVGWTQPGEWIKYTVVVNDDAVYRVGLMYTANGDGVISIGVDNKDTSGELKVTSTYNPADTVAWRQWHHWNYAKSLTTMHLTPGTHELTLRIVANGNMNFDYFEFTKQ